MRGPTRRTIAATLSASALAFPVMAAAKGAGLSIGPRVQFWATRSGGVTWDAPDGVGNPFAAALIEAMADPTLDFAGACEALRRRTAVLSEGRQEVETPGLAAAPAWRFSPPGRERRLALVITFSDYVASDRPNVLAGAANDGGRIERAFERAHFRTRLVENASRDALARELADFARQSERADVAAIYCTGHGLEWAGEQYVLFGDHIWGDGAAGLTRAEKWNDIAVAARARRLNLTLWAGCREPPE